MPLSLSLWLDEKSLIRWRTQELHHRSQARGREGVLSDYRLRIGEVATQVDENGLAHTHEPRHDLTEVSEATFVTISVDAQSPDSESLDEWRDNLVEVTQFTSLNNADRRLLLLSWQKPQFGHQWLQARTSKGTVRHYGVNIIRAYGLRDRLEAPVFHAPVTR